MYRSRRILLVHASAGDGHRQAAFALNAALRRLGAETEAVDALDLAPRAFKWWFQGGYETLVRRAPRLWGVLYRGADRPGLFYGVQNFLDFVFLSRLETLIRETGPSWVVCTHSVAQPRLQALRDRFGAATTVRSAVVVTDLYPHCMWLRGDMDRYFVGDHETLDIIRTRRPELASRISVTGIPVDPWFAEAPGRDAAKASLGMVSAQLSVPLLAGGIGGGPLREAMLAIHEALEATQLGGSRSVRLTVVCGRNAQAFRRCSAAAASLRSRKVETVVEAYVEHERFRVMLQSADFLVGKPGGLTMAESLACGVPMLIYAPLLIPGQEEYNAAFLTQRGAGLMVSNAEELQRRVGELVADAASLERLQSAARRLGRPGAATAIARELIAC